MSRTVKCEWSEPDGWHSTVREWRKARPVGRDAKAFAADLALDADELVAATLRRVCRDLGYRGPWTATDSLPAEPAVEVAA